MRVVRGGIQSNQQAYSGDKEISSVEKVPTQLDTHLKTATSGAP